MNAVDHIKALLLLFKEKLRPFIHRDLHRKNKMLIEQRRAFYKTFLAPGALAFDVGANLGNRVEVFLLCGAKVIAFEPQSTCHQFLRLKFGKQIGLQKIALGEKVATAKITLNKDSTTIATMSEQWKEKVGKDRFRAYRWGETREVTVDTLDNQVKKFGTPHFIKIDVEGFEEQVLKGLSTPVPILSFEYTTPEMAQAAVNCIRLVNNLSSRYEFNFAAGENTRFENERWMDYPAMLSLLENNIGALKGFGDIYARLKK